MLDRPERLANPWWTRLAIAFGRSPERNRDEAPTADPKFEWSETLDTATWNVPLLKALEWKRFEQLCAAYFRTLKFSVEAADFGADGGIDLRLYWEDVPQPVVVQCKAWNSWRVGVKEIRELFGVMTAEGAREGIFITTSKFSKDAREFAQGKNIALIDGHDLLEKLRNLPLEDQAAILEQVTAGDFRTPSCPSCGIKMLLRHGRESFWGCATFPRCRATLKFTSPGT